MIPSGRIVGAGYRRWSEVRPVANWHPGYLGPTCSEPGCPRGPYIAGLCKRHRDLAWYRELVRRGR